MNLVWNPMNFIKNLYWMGLGMLGIFIAIAVIVLVTIGLNRATAKLDEIKKKREENISSNE